MISYDLQYHVTLKMYRVECHVAILYHAKDIIVPNHVIHHLVILDHVHYRVTYRKLIADIRAQNLVMMVHVLREPAK